MNFYSSIFLFSWYTLFDPWVCCHTLARLSFISSVSDKVFFQFCWSIKDHHTPAINHLTHACGHLIPTHATIRYWWSQIMCLRGQDLFHYTLLDNFNMKCQSYNFWETWHKLKDGTQNLVHLWRQIKENYYYYTDILEILRFWPAWSVF